jgi:hypothetical protein
LFPKYYLEDLSVGSGSIIGKSNIEEFFNHISMHKDVEDKSLAELAPSYEVATTMPPEEMIFTFKQKSEESFKEAWSRIYDWHGKTEPEMALSLLLSCFYFGLALRYRYALDTTAEGDFLHCDGDQAFNIIKKLITIYSMPTDFDSSMEKDKSHLEGLY